MKINQVIDKLQEARDYLIFGDNKSAARVLQTCINDYSAFEDGTMNAHIFNTTAPYNNAYQGSSPRLLFVCSAGLLRSPTAATLANILGFNARACGSSIDYALIPISANLIHWADKIIFMQQENYLEALDTFKEYSWLDDLLVQKNIVWDIPDKYPAFHLELRSIIKDKLLPLVTEYNSNRGK